MDARGHNDRPDIRVNHFCNFLSESSFSHGIIMLETIDGGSCHKVGMATFGEGGGASELDLVVGLMESVHK